MKPPRICMVCKKERLYFKDEDDDICIDCYDKGMWNHYLWCIKHSKELIKELRYERKLLVE